MKKCILICIIIYAIENSATAQLSVSKLIGKNESTHKIGFGAFMNYQFPLNESGNSLLMIELLDFLYFPGKPYDASGNVRSRAYYSIKLGYKKIFSEESSTGFYVEPQAGYCRVLLLDDQWAEGKQAGGVAAALEAGYNLEVGQGGNSFLFGLKYENDMAGTDYNIQSIAFKVAFSFLIFRGRSR